MTRFAATTELFAEWAEGIESSLDDAQALAALPDEVRSFPPLALRDAVQIVGDHMTDWRWKELIRVLKDDGQLQSTPGGQHRITLGQLHAWMESEGIRPSRPPYVHRALRVAVENFKGGAGKSTTCLHLAHGLALRGYRVLVIDTDPQASVSRLLGIQPHRLDVADTLACIVDSPPTPLTPRATHIDGLHIVPASMGLTNLEVSILSMFRDNEGDRIGPLMESAFASVEADYDIILCDFQPAFSLMQTFLLHAMDSLFVPLPTETPDFAGTGDFLSQIQQFVSSIERIVGRQKVWDPVLVVHTRRKKSGDLVHNLAGRVFGIHRPPEYIEDSAAISSALACLKSVYEAGADQYDPRAIKRAREQVDNVVDVVAAAIVARWEEMKGDSHVQ